MQTDHDPDSNTSDAPFPEVDFTQKPLPSVNADTNPQTRLGTPIRLLRWIELIGLESEYKQFKKQEATDAWYYVESDEARGPVSFTELLAMVRDGNSPLSIIHESKAEADEPQWTNLNYDPAWKRPSMALWWTVGFWLIVLCIGFVALQLLLPDSIRHIVGIVYWLATLGVIYKRNKERFFAKSRADT